MYYAVQIFLDQSQVGLTYFTGQDPSKSPKSGHNIFEPAVLHSSSSSSSGSSSVEA